MRSGLVGWLALWGAIGSAAIGCAAGLRDRRRRRAPAVAVARGAALATACLAAISVAALVWSLLTGDFALAYVADTTSRQGGWPYRLAGLWGGNGGSLLLWAALVLAIGVFATWRRPGARLAVVAIGGALLAVDAAAANPFARLAIPAIDGGGLTPILQYPAMLYHPLLLYTGHAALVVPFVLAAAGLAMRRLDEAWLAATRRWMLVAWLLLGVALIAGAHWAYVELGWGGFWGWDPVENSGLLPWIAATAFLHRARGTAGVPGDRAPVGLAALAALPFTLSLVGTTLSRSGAAQSVHAFAQATAVGRGLLGVVVAAIAAIAFLVVRQPGPDSPAWPRLGAEELALGGAVIVLLGLVLVVLVGTVFPVVAQVFGGQTIAVTTRYYARVTTPLAVIALVLMGIGPAVGSFGARRPRRWIAAGALGLVGVALLWRGASGPAPAVLGGAAIFAGFLAMAELVGARRLRRAGALMAHAGMALFLFGTAGSLLGRRVTQVVRPGEAVTASGFTLRVRNLVADEGPRWQRVRVVVDVSRNGQPEVTLYPALRIFDGQSAALSDVALDSTVARDLLVTVSAIDPATGAAHLEVTVRPLMTLVWWGGLLAATGGALVLVSALTRRRRASDQGHLDASAAPLRRSPPPAALSLQEPVNRRGRRRRLAVLFPLLLLPRR